MPTGTLQFRGDLEKFATDLGLAIGEVTKKIVVDLHTEVTILTPVDTGRLRAAWVIGVGEPNASQPEEVPPDVKAARAKERKAGKESAAIFPPPPPPDLTGIDGKEPVFLTNNLEYAEAIEDGHSKKAPEGMLKVAIETIEAQFATDGGVLLPKR